MKSTAESRAQFQKEHRARQQGGMRLYGRIFEHWRECPKAGCRRGRACGGELVTCFYTWFRSKPEEEREEMRDVLRELIALNRAREAGAGAGG